jgi:hypothetical protein
MLSALHGNTMNVRTQYSFSDRRCVSGIILLSLDERLHIDGRDQANIVATALRDASPIVAGCAGLHRHDTWFMRIQHLHQLRAGNRAIK